MSTLTTQKNNPVSVEGNPGKAYQAIGSGAAQHKSDESRESSLHALQESVRKAWRLLIAFADDGSHLLDLPTGQLRCLRRIMENEGCKLIDLARETNLSLPNASRLVDRLVQRGFVMRETDPSDRRAVRLYVTSEAQGMIQQIDAKRVEHLRSMTQQLSSKQIDDAVAHFQAIAAAAERARAQEPAQPHSPALDERDEEYVERAAKA